MLYKGLFAFVKYVNCCTTFCEGNLRNNTDKEK